VAAVLLFSNVVNNSEGQLGLAPGLSLQQFLLYYYFLVFGRVG